jgi:beta-phosphoglucomutase-like phosphatase (HAD superfamily)
MRRKLKAVIFDLDGVITDTSEYHYRAWKRLTDEEGIPFTRDDNDKLRGVSRGECLKILLKGKQVSDEEFQEMMDRKNEYYVELLRQMTDF